MGVLRVQPESMCLSERQERPRRLLPALSCTRLLQLRQLRSVGWVMCVLGGSASVSFLDGVSVVVRCCMRLVAPSFVLTQHAGCFDVCLHEGLRPCEQGKGNNAHTHLQCTHRHAWTGLLLHTVWTC